MINLHQSVDESVRTLQEKSASRPDVAVILGTGLGGIVESINVTGRVPYNQIPHFPESTVAGHKGDLVFGTLSGCNLVVMQGRFHYYEGYSLQQTTFPVRVMRRLGAEILVINSAAGGLNPHVCTGDVMAIIDHLNLIGANPLRGVTDERLGDRFPDMSRPYDEELIRFAGDAALDLKIPLRHGIYAAVSGPSLETQAETRMLRMLGADAVGMSTAPAAIVAASVGFRTLALAAITNVNVPGAMGPVSVERVIANAGLAAPKLAAILEATLQRVTNSDQTPEP
jgi:purine-nucleoside phosphorylase